VTRDAVGGHTRRTELVMTDSPLVGVREGIQAWRGGGTTSHPRTR